MTVPLHTITSIKPDPNLDSSDRLIGIEFEIEGFSSSRAIDEIRDHPLFLIHNEDSLRNMGIEVVTVPLNNENYRRPITT